MRRVPRADWLTTARQTLPRLIRLVRELEPTYFLPDSRAVSPEFLRSEGIRAVVWDVDGTLMSYHAPAVDPEFVPTLQALEAMGVGQAILSNCGEERFVELGRMFPHWPVVRAYQLGSDRIYRVLLRGQDSLGTREASALLGQGAHQVRKPDGPLFLHTLGVLGDLQPEEALMVGDQHLTDIATANLASARSAKVPAWRRETFPFPVRASQWLELALYRLTRRGSSRSS